MITSDHSLKKFYVWWWQDCGYGAVMGCDSLIYAPSIEDARLTWVSLIRAEGYACHPVDANKYELIAEVPLDATRSWCSRKYPHSEAEMEQMKADAETVQVKVTWRDRLHQWVMQGLTKVFG